MKTVLTATSIEAGACRAACLLNPFRFLVFQRAAQFWIELFEALLEHEKIGSVSPSHPLFLHESRGVIQTNRSCCGISVYALRCAYPETEHKTIYGWEIHPDTHTHTRDVIWDVSRALPQQVQDKLTQKSCSWFTHFAQQGFIRAKSGLDLPQGSCKHLSTSGGNSSSFVIWKIRRKWKEKVDNIWRKLVDYWQFQFCRPLSHCFFFKVSLECI